MTTISSGTDTRVLWGAFLEVICALAGIGTAIVLFPVVKRQHVGAALGFVAARVVEAGIIITGAISLLCTGPASCHGSFPRWDSSEPP